MEKTIAIYTVRPDKVEENELAVKEVYKQLHAAAPSGFKYATFKLPDGLTFVHVALQQGEGKSPLSSLPAFHDFATGVNQRCDNPPSVNKVTEIGSYQFGLDQKI